MGFYLPTSDLPSSSSPSLILTNPTPAELVRTWTLTHPKWGPALTHDDYLQREEYLTTVPLAKDGGITHWILTDRPREPGQRLVLSSCETLRKRTLVCGPDGEVRYGIAHGIASVFTDPQLRGKGYASRMMEELGRALETWQADEGRSSSTSPPPSRGSSNGTDGAKSHFSVLYSDIGKTFYRAKGWEPY